MALDPARILRCFEQAKQALLAQRNAEGHWTGRLSSSALSTATAVMALELVRRGSAASSVDSAAREPLAALIAGGIDWLATHRNADGGWGDTLLSRSNISTTMLCHAVFCATGAAATHGEVTAAAAAYVDRAGGIAALRARYGRDHTFSIPILTHCALAGTVRWSDVAPLPFELACLPPGFYRFVRLPVVSYALPALIAIGQARHHFVKPKNPLTRCVRDAAIGKSLRVLERIQPTSGGFLEATPLTSFVVMSLAGMGRIAHPVVRHGVEFLLRSVRPDGSWPIDTNLATWVTTLAINALGPELPADAAPALREWLLHQQYAEVHPYTNADPGGWAWTDLPGGVPDADDTPGALLALLHCKRPADAPLDEALEAKVRRGVSWLLGLQNRDGGWPTFCRGWGTLPFDRSAADITAHVLRALEACRRRFTGGTDELARSMTRASDRGHRSLAAAQRPDGSWVPLWFGNQAVPGDENPTYGTARVLAALRDTGRLGKEIAQKGLAWLRQAQNPDGGWGGAPGIPSSVEETALAAEVCLSLERQGQAVSEGSRRGLVWLLDRVDGETWAEPSPIGFYFAKLWYFEKLYPMIFTVAALRRAAELVRSKTSAGSLL